MCEESGPHGLKKDMIKIGPQNMGHKLYSNEDTRYNQKFGADADLDVRLFVMVGLEQEESRTDRSYCYKLCVNV